MCSCEGAFRCSRCKAIDTRDWLILNEPDDREIEESARYQDSRRRLEDEKT